MTQYSKPTHRGRLFDRRWTVSLGTEKDSGVKHTHLGSMGGGYSFQKGPSDFLFSVTLAIQNVADGSRWRVEKASDGSTIDGGVQSGTGDISVSIGYTGSPLTVKIKVRKASGPPRYKAFETNAVVGATGGSAYVSQILDE